MTEKKKVVEEQPTKQKFDAVAAHELLQEELDKQEAACAAMIQQALARFKCRLLAEPGLTPDGRIGATIQIRSTLRL